MRVLPGTPWPLGAHWDGTGTDVALRAAVAEAVEVCLFDDDGAETRLELPGRLGPVHHGRLPGVGPGTRYGFRVHGPHDLDAGHRCNPAKLLLDPAARAVDGVDVAWDDAVTDGASAADSAPFVPKSVVVDPAFDWGDDRPPATPLADSVVYEVHVKGFTATHPGVPPELRGTYAGFASPAALDHLTGLGVTAVELLPVQHFVHERRLVELGLRNFWGYAPIAWSAPHAAYSSSGTRGQQVTELKAMVKALHAAGIEVLLDVVYNHTAEGGADGPTLCLKGVDNAGSYHLDPDDRTRYVDHTGTGNSVDTGSPAVLQLVLDSLRYWVTEAHVDGFRFDLATALARTEAGFDHRSAFLAAVGQDPVLAGVKLIAEPWDLGPGGYRVGGFPAPWSEWDGRYRDRVRDHWRGACASPAPFASSLAGSADLYQPAGRPPSAGVNLLTSHDGFTLADLVAYEHKRNDANGEGGRDGEDHNRSENLGVEGPTDDPEVLERRARQRRTLLATLLLSTGVPMLLGGDELGRTQGGNNNCYCHDDPRSWFDWAGADRELLAFASWLVRFRRAHPVFRRRRFFAGRHREAPPDLVWRTPAGAELQPGDWDTAGPALAAVYDGSASPDVDDTGEPMADDRFVLLANPGRDAVAFTLPEGGWAVEVDTTEAVPAAGARAAERHYEVGARALVLLRSSRLQA